MIPCAQQSLEREKSACRLREKSNTGSGNYLYIFGLLAAVLYLPYFVPQHPAASDAYVFGYNNRAGVILLVTLCAGLAVWKKGFDLKLLPAGSPQKVSPRTLGICLVIQLVACLTMVLIMRPFGGFGESTYEIDRIWLLAQGKTPYIGFEWPFGPLSLCGPVWISHLLHCGVANGYYIFWTLASLAGVALLFATINRLDYPSPHKTAIFTLFFAAFLPATLGMGTHYTWVRYITPLWCILVVHRASVRRSKAGGGMFVAAIAVCCAAVLLLISPEMAIAFCFACCVLLIPRKSPLSPVGIDVYAYGGTIAGLLALFGLSFKLHVLDTLIASGGGADSLPITLSAPVLFFFGVVFVCCCALVRRWSDASVNDNSFVLILVAVPLLAAALGRCDPGHMFSNGVGLFLAVSLYASASRRMWPRFRNAFILVMIALPGFTIFHYVIPLIGGSAAEAVRNESVRGDNGIPAGLAKWCVNRFPGWLGGSGQVGGRIVTMAPARIEFAAIYPGFGSAQSDEVVEAPFGYKPNGLGSYLSSTVDYGYYEGLENANTPRAVQRKIDELAQHPDRKLLLPARFEDSCRVNAVGERHLITMFLFFPYTASVSHWVGVHEPICDYITGHYHLVHKPAPDNFEYGLWSPNTNFLARR